MHTSLPPDDLALLHRLVRLHRPELAPLLDKLGHIPLSLEQRGQLRVALSCEWWKHGAQSTEPPTRVTRLRELARCIRMRCALDADDLSLLREIVTDRLPALALRLDDSSRPILADNERRQLQDVLLRAIKDAGSGKPQPRGDPTSLAARLRQLEGHIWACSPLLPADMQLLREAVEKHRPMLLPLLDTLGEVPLTREQREDLQSGAVLGEFLDNLDSRDEPNERGLRADLLLDYVRWV
jgi:hypothetical protein